MKMCPNCGTPLERKKLTNKILWKCPVCGYEVEDEGHVEKPKYGLTFKPQNKREDVIIEERMRMGALSEITSCPKCGHSPVYYTSLQTRAADEPPVRIYKCPKCGYSWREYS